MFNVAYGQIFDRAEQLTTSILPENSVNISAVVRSSHENFIVRLTTNVSPPVSVAIRFPLGGQNGDLVNHLQVTSALRNAAQKLSSGATSEIGQEVGQFHELALVDGEALLYDTAPDSGAVTESIYLTLRSLHLHAATGKDNSDQSRRLFPFILSGFSNHRDGILRVYLEFNDREGIIALDLPIAKSGDSVAKTAGASLVLELSALFRDGVPGNIAESEATPDEYSDHAYDLGPWFTGNPGSSNKRPS